MKLSIMLLVFPIIIMTWGILELDSKLQNEREENNRNRRERDMYEKLFRTANTRLYQFQDSINQHCICK